METQRILLAERIADAWNANAIVYAVAHGIGRYPEAIGRDLDVFVEARHLEAARQVLEETLQAEEWHVYADSRVTGYRVFAARPAQGAMHFFEVDLFDRLSWGPILLATRVEHPMHTGPFQVDPWISYVKTTLISRLQGSQNGTSIRIETWAAGPEQAVVKSRCTELFGSTLADHLLDPGRQAVSPRGIWPSIIRRVLAQPVQAFQAMLCSVRNDIQHRLLARPVSPMVALAGPDGSGKSALIRALKQHRYGLFADVAVRYWRPGLLPALASLARKESMTSDGLPQPPRRTPGKGHWFRLAYYWVDFVLGHYFKDRPDSDQLTVICYDRCALDMSVDPVRYGLGSAQGTRLLWRLIPKPNLVILLHDTPARIHARKQELSQDEIDTQLQQWWLLTAKGEIDAVLHVNTNPEKLASRLKALIGEAFFANNMSRDRQTPHWLAPILTGYPQSQFVRQHRLSRAGTHNQSMRYLEMADGRGYLFDRLRGPASAQMLAIYNAQNTKARLVRRLLATRIGEYVVPKVQFVSHTQPGDVIWPIPLFEHLKRVLGLEKAAFSVSLGTPGPERKPVIQITTPSGVIIGYAKVGWNTKTNTLVKSEMEALKRLHKTALSTFEVPRILYQGLWHDISLLVQSPPREPVQPAPRGIDEAYLAIVGQLASLETTQVTLAKSDLWLCLENQIANVSQVYYQDLLSEGMATLADQTGDLPVEFCFCHGDFAPWNVKLSGGRLFVFDWEHARAAPAGFDLIHFFVQTQSLFHHAPPGAVCRSFGQGGEAYRWLTQHLKQTGSAPDMVYPLFELYLVDRLARAVLDAPQDIATLRRLALILSLCIYGKCGIP